MFSLLSSIAITNFIYLIFGKLLKGKKINSVKDYAEVSIIGFVYLSFIALLINFFSPLSIFVNSVVFILISIIFLLKRTLFNKNELILFTIFLCFCFLTIIYDTVYRPDAGLYHLPFVKIINDEKIIFGLTNLHARFGHISIIQYISAINNNFFTKDFGILIPLISIYSFITFYFLGDILEFILNKKKNYNYLSIFFSSSVLIYVSYKINRYGEFGNDAIGNLSYFYLLSIIINQKKFDYLEFNKLYLISVFAVLNKFTFIFALLLPAYFFFKNKISLNKSLFSIPTLFLFFWILKNIIISGCAVYPEIKTCFVDLKWVDKNEIIYQSNSAEAWAKDWPNRLEKNLSMTEYNKDFNWLSTWKNNHLKKIVSIMLPYLMVLFVIFLYFKINIKKQNKLYFNIFSIKISLWVSFIGSIFFFLKFPTYRYGYSYLISFLILFLILIIKFYNKKKIIKFCFFSITIFIISFLYKQTDRYVNYSKIRTLVPVIYNNKYPYKKIYTNEENFYNLSEDGSCMYDVNLCTLFKNDKLKINKKFSYNFYIVDN
jgi:hypothetical protein